MGLIGRAKSMVQGWSAAAPTRSHPYSVPCAQGHRLRGMRNEGYQALRCPTCGEGIFVLPRSPLPEPPVPASSTRSRVSAAIEAFPDDDPLVLTDPVISFGQEIGVDEPEAEIDWADESPAETHRPASKSSEAVRVQPLTPASKASKATAPTAPASNRSPARRLESKPDVPVPKRLSVGEWAFRHRNAILVATVLLLIVGTVAIRRRRQRLEDFPRLAELGRTEGLKKLDAGEFHAAKKLLADAADAVDGLGGRFEGADLIRQGALEAAIFADLAPKGIDEILEEAATRDPKEWPSRFAALYKGRSLIIDPPISDVPDPGRPGSSYQVNLPIYFGRGPRPDGKGRVDVSHLRLFELAQPRVLEQKPFGARYASIELDLNSNEWVVRLEPDSGVFIIHPKALEAIEWGAPESSEEPGP